MFSGFAIFWVVLMFLNRDKPEWQRDMPQMVVRLILFVAFGTFVSIVVHVSS